MRHVGLCFVLLTLIDGNSAAANYVALLFWYNSVIDFSKDENGPTDDSVITSEVLVKVFLRP